MLAAVTARIEKGRLETLSGRGLNGNVIRLGCVLCESAGDEIKRWLMIRQRARMTQAYGLRWHGRGRACWYLCIF